MRLLNEAGMTTNEDEMLDVIKQSELDVRERGRTLAYRLKFRVSGQRLVELNSRVRQKKS